MNELNSVDNHVIIQTIISLFIIQIVLKTWIQFTQIQNQIKSSLWTWTLKTKHSE